MPTIDNHLYESSFQYNHLDGTDYLGTREAELIKLQEVWDFCRMNEEKLLCDMEALYMIEVEPGINLCDWIYGNQGTGSHDARSMLLYMIDSFSEYESAGDGEISIALGCYQGCISTVEEYIGKRRDFLSNIADVEEFGIFMKSCFLNSVFSDNIITAMKRIPRFRECTRQIVSNLALLNDHAIEIYERHNRDAAKAMRELTARAVECTGDPAHKAFLKFPFSYCETGNDDEQNYMEKEIECSPHMKLLRPDSNLRIYFYWFDDKVGDGEKVLIGRIGSHPY